MMIDGIPKLAFLWSKFQSRAFEFLVFNAFFRPNFGCANSMMEELRGNLYPNNMWMVRQWFHYRFSQQNQLMLDYCW
jgi:hypothetical protein